MQPADRGYYTPKYNAAKQIRHWMWLERNCKTRNHKPDKDFRACQRWRKSKSHAKPDLHDAREKSYLPADRPEAAGEQKPA